MRFKVKLPPDVQERHKRIQAEIAGACGHPKPNANRLPREVALIVALEDEEERQRGQA